MSKKVLTALIVMFALGALAYAAAKELSRLGDNQGYAPIQPIAFSHKVHAGDNQVSCFYCHYGVERSRHAGIPADSVCLNCHNNIKKDSPEIAKIKKALDEKKPIEWMKVNRMADFVYFSHERHVGAGKISCQTCHGPVETMARLRQEKSFTMGWCLNCHRTSDVVVHSTKQVMKESDVGGQDCAKCHY
jgi:hypothetical protein